MLSKTYSLKITLCNLLDCICIKYSVIDHCWWRLPYWWLVLLFDLCDQTLKIVQQYKIHKSSYYGFRLCMWGETEGRIWRRQRQTYGQIWKRQWQEEKTLDLFLQILVINFPEVPAHAGNRNLFFQSVASHYTNSGTEVRSLDWIFTASKFRAVCSVISKWGYLKLKC